MMLLMWSSVDVFVYCVGLGLFSLVFQRCDIMNIVNFILVL